VLVPDDLAAVWHELRRRFAAREQSDIARVRKVADLLGGEGCLVRRLLHYFGEELGRDCGHCGRCEGEPAVPLEREAEGALPAFGPDEVGALRAAHPRALGGARQLARFFCGITSPALTAGKLTRHPRFGSLADVPFGKVMEAVKDALETR
jgi:ATP-dependent DNA helicase RecQ